MERTYTWLHLSDFHFRVGDQYDQQVVITSLLNDINDQRLQQGVTADAIFLTGDIAFSGKAEEYQVAREFIEKLISVSGVELSNIFCVPGNHDVDRSRITASLRTESRALTNREHVSRVIGTNKLSLFTDRYASYSEFIRSTFPWAEHWTDRNLSFTQDLNIRGIKISLLGLNSAWVSGADDDQGNLLIGERQVREALDKAKQPEILIALFHHPLSYLTDFDSSDVQALLNTRCDFVLHGHLHETQAARLVSPDSEVFYLAAGASYQGRQEALAYNRVTLNLDKGEAEIMLRRYSDRQGGFWSPDTSAFRSAQDGVFRFSLPERLSRNEKLISIPAAQAEMAAFMPESVPEAKTIEPLAVIPPPPHDLINLLLRGRCVLFAGAGASMDAKLPSWQEMIRDLVDSVEEVGALDNDADEVRNLLAQGELLILADYCREKLGPYDFAHYIRERLSTAARVSRTHRLLSEIPFRAAVTTNFDPFIERSRENAEVILPDKMEKLGSAGVADILRDNSSFPVVKMHGSYKDPESIVLTQKDFRSLLFEKPKYREFLKQLFTQFTFFFYGYSFSDPNVNFMLQDIMSTYEGRARPHYALLPDPGRITRNYWFEIFQCPHNPLLAVARFPPRSNDIYSIIS
jgi:predicted phosphodiesterase